jgi:transposase
MPTEVARAKVRKKITVKATARRTKASVMKALLPAMMEARMSRMKKPNKTRGHRFEIYSSSRPKTTGTAKEKEVRKTIEIGG